MPVLNWIGKEAGENHDKEGPFRLLKKVKAHSVGKNSQNLIIHGDNLEALKALMPYYIGKIKCIYIDPPYNTGNESWVYNDKVNSPKIKKWLGKVVGRESEDLCRHDKWLCMMYPRLKLLKDLLAEDGVIFVSIDDNEHCNLKGIMDEIFGEDNFRNVIIIRRGVKSVQAQFESIDKLGLGAEYVFVYTKNSSHRFKPFHVEIEESKPGSWNNHWRGTDRPTMRYELFGITPEKGQWRWSKKRSYEAIKNYEKCINGIGKPLKEISQEDIDKWYTDNYPDEDFDMLRLSSNKKPEHYIAPTDSKFASSLWVDLKPNGSSQLKKLFGVKLFDNPKSVDLIKRLIVFAATEKDSIILDSFAGSGTTGHAVMQLNQDDDGLRKFILIQIDEELKDHIKVPDGTIFKDVISITHERIKRSMKKYEYNGGFEFCELDKPLFNEEGQIEQECTFEQLATYIYFTETNTNLDTKLIDNYFVGAYNETEFYLLFKEKGKNILNKDFLRKIKKNDQKKVIYADKCLIDDKILEKLKIKFKQIPYEVRVY